MMDTMISRFPEQLAEAIDISETIDISNIERNDIENILVLGLGGSGIGGNFVQQFVRKELSVPFVVSKTYDIPQFVNNKTLVIASSYSGNTEETLEAYQKSKDKGAQIFIITSGGKLLDLAQEHSHAHVILPDDWDSPRACLGYSFIQQLGLLNKLGMISDSFKSDLLSAKNLLEDDMDHIKQKGRQLAHFIHEKTPVIYSSDVYEPVAVRWRQQINENGKALAWHHAVPEMNHNELVGWRNQRNDLTVIMLRNKDDHPRTQLRMDINKEIIAHYAGAYIDVLSKGDSTIERAMYLVHLGDWTSWFLSELNERDAVEVEVIDFLKGELKKH